MKRIALFALVILTSITAMAGPLTSWTLQRQGQKQTYKAQVPCTVAGVLNEAGVFGQDVLDQDRYKAIDKSIFDEPWVFTSSAFLPSRACAARRASTCDSFSLLFIIRYFPISSAVSVRRSFSSVMVTRT